MGITIGQSYEDNLDIEVTDPLTDDGVGQVPANSADMTGTLETADPEKKGSSEDVSAVAQNADNLGPVSEDEEEETPTGSETPTQDPNLLGAVAPGTEDLPQTVVSEDGSKVEEVPGPEQETDEDGEPQDSADGDSEDSGDTEDTGADEEPEEDEESDYDPADHDYKDVLEHLKTVSPEEKERILTLEEQGKKRVRILGA